MSFIEFVWFNWSIGVATYWPNPNWLQYYREYKASKEGTFWDKLQGIIDSMFN